MRASPGSTYARRGRRSCRSPTARSTSCWPSWDQAGGTGPLSLFWRAAQDLHPSSGGEAGLPGTREGHLTALAGRAGLVDVEPSVLTVRLAFDTFADWWDPFTLGVGPAGVYVGRLSPGDRDALAARCAELLGPPPFEVRASAWTVRARPPAR